MYHNHRPVSCHNRRVFYTSKTASPGASHLPWESARLPAYEGGGGMYYTYLVPRRALANYTIGLMSHTHCSDIRAKATKRGDCKDSSTKLPNQTRGLEHAVSFFVGPGECIARYSAENPHSISVQFRGVPLTPFKHTRCCTRKVTTSKTRPRLSSWTVLYIA